MCLKTSWGSWSLWHQFHTLFTGEIGSRFEIFSVSNLLLEAFPLLTRHEPTEDTLKAMFCFPLRTWPHGNATYKQVVLGEFDDKSPRKTWISQNSTELYSFLRRNRSGVITMISAKLLNCCIFVFQMPFLTGASWCFSLTTATEYRWSFDASFSSGMERCQRKQQEVKIWIYPKPGKWKVTVCIGPLEKREEYASSVEDGCELK